MLLSVGMIVKNEEKRLEKCLAALMPVISAVGGELVIADTGSTDHTVDIARKFTDRVFGFEWIRDFSAARNFTLEKSQGEWFMFIDADEVLIDGRELTEFFTSGEYKKYNSATYIQRNYSDSTMTGYSDYAVQRIVRCTPQTHFENPVHEVLVPFEAPTKRLGTAVAHSGYVYENEEQRLAKSRRNIEILLTRLESGATPLLYLQLGQSFALCNEKKALEYFNKGIELSRCTGDIAFFPLYNEVAAAYYRAGDWKKTAEVCRDYFRDRTGFRPESAATDAEMHGIYALALQYSGDYPGAYEEHSACRKLWKIRDSGGLDTPDTALVCFYITVESNRAAMRRSFLQVCLALGKYSEAGDIAREMGGGELCQAEGMFRQEAARSGDVSAFLEWGRVCSEIPSDAVCRAAAESAAALERGDRKACIGALTSLLRECPEMKRAVISVRDMLAQQSEMDRLAAEIKANIRALSASGESEQAAALLSEFIGIAPDDRDIPALKQLTGLE